MQVESLYEGVNELTNFNLFPCYKGSWYAVFLVSSKVII